MFTVQNALDLSAEHVGFCASSPKVLAKVNEAVRRLLPTDDYQHTLDQVRYFTQNNSITLSREHVAARMVDICGTPVDICSQAYEYVQSGPGEYQWDQLPKLIDAGTYPVFFDPPTDYTTYLFAASTSVDDASLSITYTGKTTGGADILTSTGANRQTLAIDSWVADAEGTLDHVITLISDTPVPNITSVVLPAGRKGYVSLYAYEATTGRMWFLAKYHPSETIPGYRRYRLPVFCPDYGMQVHCLCKKQYIPATSGDDILLVQNLDAIKLMVKAIERENVNDINGAVAFQQLAIAQLQTQQGNESRGIRFNFVCESDGPGVNII